MADRIKIFGIEIKFGKAPEDLEKVNKLTKEMIASIEKATTSWKGFTSEVRNTEGIRELLKILKQMESTSAKATTTRKQLTAEQRNANAALREARREEDLKLKVEQSHLGSINQLKAQASLLSMEWSKMSKKERESTTEGQNLSRQLKSIRSELNMAKMGVGDFSSNIGNYMSGLYNKTTAIIGGVLGVVMTIKQALSGIFSNFQDFEYKMAMVKAISGATADEFDRLEANARKLGASTEFTAIEVADLQLAYSRMGFVPDQIIAMTEATLDLATATGEELAKSADIVGVVIKGFGLEAKDSTRVVDVMARSFNSSSLNLDSFANAMKYVAPIAANANISLEQTTAMLGVLADRGVRGTQAGTALRRIFTDIAAEGGNVNDRLAQLNESGITLGGAMDEVGRTAMTALTVLANSGSNLNTLTTALNDAEGAAKSAADGIRDTVQGDLDSFLSVVQDKLISMGEFLEPIGRWFLQFGTSAVRGLGAVVSALSPVIKALGIIAVATIAQKTYLAAVATIKNILISLQIRYTIGIEAATLATNAETAASGKNSIAQSIRLMWTKALTFTMGFFTASTAAATLATKIFTGALLATGIGAIAIGIGALVGWMMNLAAETNKAADAQSRFSDEFERFNEKIKERKDLSQQLISTIQSETASEWEKLKAYNELKIIMPSLTEQYSLKQLQEENTTVVNKTVGEIIDKDVFEEQLERISKLKKALADLEAEDGSTYTVVGPTPQTITRDYSKQIAATKAEIAEAQKLISEYRKLKEDAAAQSEYDALSLKLKIKFHADKAEVLQAEFDDLKAKYDAEVKKWEEANKNNPIVIQSPVLLQMEGDLGRLDQMIKDNQSKAKSLNKGGNNNGDDGDKKTEWSLSNDKAYNAKILELKRQLLDGEIATEKEYQAQVLQLEIDTLKARIDLKRDSNKTILKLNGQLLDKQLKQEADAEKRREAFDKARKKLAEETAQYQSDEQAAMEDAAIDAMEDSVLKRIKLNDLATKRALDKADQQAFKQIESIEKIQSEYEVDSKEYQQLEGDKTDILAAHETKRGRILMSGDRARAKILDNAKADELDAYAACEQRQGEAEAAKTANTKREAEKRMAEIKKEYEQAKTLAQAKYDAVNNNINQSDMSDDDKVAAKLQNEINLRKELAELTQSYAQNLEAAGQVDTPEFSEALDGMRAVQKEAENLGNGLNADGSGGNWLQRVFELDKQKQKQLASEAFSLAQDISDGIFDIQKAANQRKLDNELDTLEAQYKVESKLLDSRRDKGLISEKKYKAQLEKLEEDKLKKEEAAKRASFEREKRLNLMQILVNTALTIGKTFAMMGWPMAIPFAAMAAAQGAVQYAMVASQKYAQGGIIPVGDKMGVVKGRSHAEGGHQLYLDGRPIGEIEGDELIAIVNKHDTARIGALSRANSVSGKKFANGGLISPVYETSQVAPPAYYRSGDSGMNEWCREMVSLLNARLDSTNSRIDNLRVSVVAQDVTDVQDDIKKVRTKATW